MFNSFAQWIGTFFGWIYDQVINIWGYTKSFLFWVGAAILGIFVFIGHVLEFLFQQLQALYGYVTSIPPLPGVVGNVNVVPHDALAFANTFFPVHEFIVLIVAYLALVLLCATIRVIKSLIPTEAS